MTYEGLPKAARNVAHAVEFNIAVSLGLERPIVLLNRIDQSSIEDQSQWLRDQDHQPKSTRQNVTSQLINLE